MAKNGFKVLDSDMHIMEPPDMWEHYLDPEFRDSGPRGLTEHVVQGYVAHPDGRPWGMNPIAFEQRTSPHLEKNKEKLRYFYEKGFSSESQLEAMDTEGIDVAVIYPTFGLYAMAEPDLEPRLAAAVARAYNNWLYDFCQTNPDRLVGAGMVSPYGVEDAVVEARRCVQELGFRGVFLRPNEVGGRNWHDPYYDPLWGTLAELDAPLGFHEGAGAALPHVGEQFKHNVLLRHVFCHPAEQMLATASICAGGVLERHPNLKIAFLEGNCSWLPFLLWRLDEHQEMLGDIYAPELKMLPSEYFKRQCFASAEADEEPVRYVIDYMGNDRLVFSTDFPHYDSKFPKAVARFLELQITDDDKRKILWDNCAQYYGLE